MYPRMCIYGGLSYPMLLDRLIALAIANYTAKRSLRFDFPKMNKYLLY